MAKKTPYDFNVGLLGLTAPSTSDAYETSTVDIKKKKELSDQKIGFQKVLRVAVQKKVSSLHQFPTDRPVFVFIMQCFSSEKEYQAKDLDNLAKTILDTLKGTVYQDDTQVKTLLVTKKVQDGRIPDNFLYVTVKVQKVDADVPSVHQAGLEQAFRLYQELKKH